MLIHDEQIVWKRKKLILYANEFQSGDNVSGVNISKVTSRPIQGVHWGATGHAVGDKVELVKILPPVMDPQYELGVHLWWITDSSTAADTITWIALMALKAESAALATAATGALNTVLVADTVGAATAFLLKRTARGIKNANWLVPGNLFDGYWMQMSIELDATAIDIAGVENVWLLAVELDYVPMETRHPHSRVDAPLRDDMQ